MKKPILVSLYILLYPITLLISFTINFLIIFSFLDAKYVGLGMILLSACSISYLIRLMIKTRFFRLPMQENEANILIHSNPKCKLFSYTIIISFILWAISLFWVQFLR